MNKKLMIAAVTFPLMLGVASAYASGGHGKWGERGHGDRQACNGGIERGMMRELDLTDDQKQQFKELRNETQTKMRERFEEQFAEKAKARRANHEKMQQLILADDFDRVAAMKLAQEQANGKADFMVQKMERQHDMLNILTPEQKEKFVELQQERQQDCQDRMARHGKKYK